MAGRPLKPLPPDGGPLVRLAEELRQLRERAGSPSYARMGRRVGYSASVLSGLFNAERLPSADLLADVVTYLGADSADWLRRRDAAEQALHALTGAGVRESRLQHEIDRLRAALDERDAELERLRALVAAPDTATAAAERAQRDAESRLNTARRTEARLLDITADLHRGLADSQRQVESAQRAAQDIVSSAEGEAVRIIAEAGAQARDTVRAATDKAVDMTETARQEAERLIAEATRAAWDRQAEGAVEADRLVREAQAVAAEMEEDRADALRRTERLVTRAELEVHRIIVTAGAALASVGRFDEADALARVLRESALNSLTAAQPPGPGRHRRADPSDENADRAV